MVVELRFFYTIIFPISAPQIRRYQQDPVNGAYPVIAWSLRVYKAYCVNYAVNVINISQIMEIGN